MRKESGPIRRESTGEALTDELTEHNDPDVGSVVTQRLICDALVEDDQCSLAHVHCEEAEVWCPWKCRRLLLTPSCRDGACLIPIDGVGFGHHKYSQSAIGRSVDEL